MFKGFPKRAFPDKSFPTVRIANVGAISDNDAHLFAIAAGIVDDLERQAIYFLVQELKRFGLWDKMIAIYPMRGGTAESTSFNLKNPARFKITWINAPTFSFNGVVGNGTNQYGNLGLNAFTQLTISDLSISFYSRTSSISGIRCGIGVQTSSSDYSVFTHGPTGYARIGSQQTLFTGAANGSGLFMANRSALNNLKAFHNGVLRTTNTTAITAPVVNQNFFILARNFNAGVPDAYTTQQCSFAHVGNSLTDDEAATFYSIVQEYQTILGIAV
jgi:hypothetical protein